MDSAKPYELRVRQADTWDIQMTGFEIEIDQRDTISEHGDGMYTVTVWGTLRLGGGGPTRAGMAGLN